MKKKVYLLFAIIGLGVATLCSCGEKKITVNGTDGTEYESYQECCAANDYEAAHKYLAKMQNDEAFSKDYNNAKEFVFKQEALFLMSQGDENAKKRIVYLLKEEGDNNDHVSMLIDLAIENDDESFVKTLGNQYTIGVESENLKKLSEYLSSKQSEENKEFLMALFKKLDEEDLLLEQAIKNNDKAFILEYASDHLTLSNTALLNYLAEMNDKQLSEKILGILTEKENDIPNKPSLGTIQSDYKGQPDRVYDSYIHSVENYNNACRTLLNIAIKNKNSYLAQRIVNKGKQNIAYKTIGSWRIVEKSYNGTALKAIKVELNNTDINDIKASYQEAVRSGAFK